MKYSKIENTGGLFIYFKYRLVHKLIILFISGILLTNLVFFIKRNFSKIELDDSLGDLLNAYESAIGQLKVKTLETYFDGILTELRGITDTFSSDKSYVNSGSQTSYCYNVISSNNIGALPTTNPGCLEVVCLNGASNPACIADRAYFNIMIDVFEILLSSEKNIYNYIIILPDTGTILSHESMISYLNYANLGVCAGTTSDDLTDCLQNEAQCLSTVKLCLSYINCKGRYTTTIPENPLVDFRCLPFYQQTLSNNGADFLFFAQNIYAKTTIAESLFLCFQGSTSSTSKFVSCMILSLSDILKYANIQENSTDIILFFQGDMELYLSSSDQGKNVEFLAETTTNVLATTEDNFPLKSCMEAIKTDSISFLSEFVEKDPPTTGGYYDQLDFGDCSLVAIKWRLTLDTTTDLSSAKNTYQFYLMSITDLTEARKIQDDVTYISKKILFCKLFCEVLLSQLFFIFIQKIVKRLVKEFTRPLNKMGEVLYDFTQADLDENFIEKLEEIDVKYLELVDLKNQITDFGYLCVVNKMINTKEVGLLVLERALDIFIAKQNVDGLYVIYTHLVDHLLEKKRFLEAIANVEDLIHELENLKEVMTSGNNYNNDELTLVNLKLFFNFYKLINMRKKYLAGEEMNKRSYWQDVLNNFRELFSLLNEIEIKETVVLKLMIKKANIHFYLDKINHAEEAITEAMCRYQDYVKHDKTPVHWSQDQKILCYLQQKLYYSYAMIKMKKYLYKEAYDYFLRSLEFGLIYSPNIRSKCYDGLTQLFKTIDEEDFQDEIVYAKQLKSFYKQNKKEFMFLLDSTKELNRNLGDIHRLIKDIFETKMREKDSFSIYSFSHEIKIIQDSTKKKSIKRNEMEVFDQAYDFLKESANQIYRHSWDAISDALDILIDLKEGEDLSKYLVVFVFGDIVPMVNRNVRPEKKKMTMLWQQNVQEVQKRQFNYEKLIEKVEDSFVNLIIFGYNLEPNTKGMYQKICEVAKNGLFVNIVNDHSHEEINELLDFFS